MKQFPHQQLPSLFRSCMCIVTSKVVLFHSLEANVMRTGKYAIIGLLAILLIGLIGTPIPGAFMTLESDTDLPFSSVSDKTLHEENSVRSKVFSISSEPNEGVLNPIRIRQSGYQTTDLARGNTDAGIGTTKNITIDEANGWFVNNTAVAVSNLKRLYCFNGTFENGTDPWTTYSIDGGSNTQLHSYDSSGGYIVCRNMGQYNPAGGGSYTHSQGSEVGWEQVLNNSPASLNFKLEFDFRYPTGPIDPDGDDTFDGDVGVFWELDSDNFWEGWYWPMQNLDSRETWYSVTHEFDPLIVADSTLTLRVGLYIGAGNVRVYNLDYDDDPLGELDGWDNAQNVTVYIDNVEFTSTTAPGFEDVDLTFHAEGLSSSITGTGTGTATITNPSLWTVDPLEVQITANASVIFTYSITTLFHRYINSSWTTDLSKEGVQYSVTAGQSPDLSLFTYVTPSAEYDDVTLDLLYPKDWENATVLDPLSIDITSNCVVSPGRIHVPNSEMSRSGWWEVDLQSPNYARNVSIQVQDGGTGEWSENSLFRSGNVTRTQVEIGTQSSTPAQGDPVNVTWVMPDESIWALDAIMAMTNGMVNSSSLTLAGTNTTAGQWQVEAAWTNGTEIAFDISSFDMYHTATITPHQASVDADAGQLITNMVYFVDIDTGDYLMDDSASIEGNWSASTIVFTPNLVKNWWEADFDTSLLSSGRYVIVVNASRPYFENVSCQFVITSTYRTDFQLTSVGGIPVEAGLYEVVTVDVRYEIEGGSGIDGATISMDYSGPGGGLTLLGQSSSGSGDYSVNMSSSISGTYTITLTGSKDYHHNESDTFTLIVGEIGTDLSLTNGTADFTSLGTAYRLVLRYANSTDYGLASADLEVVDVTPSTGLIYDNATYSGNGYYSILLDSTSARTFTLVIRANLTNHETQYATFTITVSEIPSVLVVDASTARISVGQNHTIQFLFQDDQSNGLESAIIYALSPPDEVLVDSFIELSGGYYSITVESPQTGVYQMAFRAHLDDYQDSTVGFTLIVGYVTMRISDVQGLTSIEGQDVELRVRVVDADTGDPIVGATVQYLIIIGTQVGTLTGMVEVSPGVYTANIVMPSFGYNSTIRILVSLDDHELQGGVFEARMTPLESEAAALGRTLQRVFPFALLAAVAAVGLAGRRTYIGRERERNLEATIVKRRFDAVQSLIGVIVLHKHTGIPIFSKMVKGGIDGMLVSGFITAITNFRTEFKVDQEEGAITPISDIIRTVATENLICAFISLSSPSVSQELRMIEFAETVGFVFDNMFTEPPMVALEYGTVLQFEALFDDILDGRLLKEYKVSDLRGFPRKTKCIEERIDRIGSDGPFELEELAKEMTSCGLEEARVYKMIMEAIENSNLVTAKVEEMREGDSDSDVVTRW